MLADERMLCFGGGGGVCVGLVITYHGRFEDCESLVGHCFLFATAE